MNTIDSKNIKTIKTIDELLDFITELNKLHNYRLWFRGMADEKWDLLPSIQRSSKTIENERFITNDFYIKAKQVMEHSPDKKNYAAWMSIMQHYGLPTRLLDWSSSPLIAAFFAVEKYKLHSNTDACIWILAPGLLNKIEGFGDCIYPVDAITVQHMLSPAFKERKKPSKHDNKIIACHSTENNLRMYSQQANFTIHNSYRNLTSVNASNMLYKVIIPSECRERFLYNLKIFGITESFIYPDLEHISKDIKSMYGL